MMFIFKYIQWRLKAFLSYQQPANLPNIFGRLLSALNQSTHQGI